MDPRTVLVFFILLLNNVHCKSLVHLSCNDIQNFVDGHNWRRLLLAQGKLDNQPAASEMKYMVWDDELAAKAEKWAYEYTNSHNPDRNIDSGRFTTGENLYTYSTTNRNYKLDVEMPLEKWFGEHKDYRFAPLNRNHFDPTTADVGHYTQMVWANTTYIGCATLQNQTQNWNNFYVVCNYGPAGNYIGEAPYKAGSPSERLTCGTFDCSNLYGDTC